VVHLVTALAPLGEMLLMVVAAVARFISILPTGVLGTAIAGFVALWIAIRLFKGVAAIATALSSLVTVFKEFAILAKLQALASSFAGMLLRVADSMGIATGATDGLRVAIVGLGAAFVIGAVIAGVVAALSAISSANDKATESTRKHAEAVKSLAQQYRDSKGLTTSDIRNEAANRLTAKENVYVDLPGLNQGENVQSSIADVAQRAGVPLAQASAGLIGDDAARKKTQQGLDDYRKSKEQELKDYQHASAYGLTKVDPKKEDALTREVALSKKASEEYRVQAVSMGELTAANVQWIAAGGKTAEQLTAIAEGAGLATDRFKKLGEQTEPQQQITAAVTAYDAYTSAIKASSEAILAQKQAEIDTARAIEDAKQKVVDAHKSLVESQNNVIKSTESLTQARKDAAQQIVEYQRVLRDIPLDEEQASINLARAKDALRKGASSPLERRQQRLDLKRARNDQSDLLADDAVKRDTAQRGIDTGVEASQIVKDAAKALTDAIAAQAQAQTVYNRAQQDLGPAIAVANKSLADATANAELLAKKVGEASLALDQSAAAAGLTRDTLVDLRKKQDAIDHDMQIHLNLIDPSDTAGKLNEIATSMEALKLLADDPSLSPAQAYEKAAANAKKNYAAVFKVGGKGHTRDSGYATGGPIDGPGTTTSDDVPVWLSRGEHVWTASEVVAAGGHTMVRMLREAALNRKLAAADPTADLRVSRRFADATPAGRPAPGLYRLDPRELAGALDVAARTALAPVAAPAAARVQTVDNSTHRHLSTGDITINNPVREQAGGSLYRAVRRFNRDYD
jgi:hypothetical protein